MALKTHEERYVFAAKSSSLHHGNKRNNNNLSSEVNIEEMHKKTEKIYWHTNGVKIDFDMWDRDEDIKKEIERENEKISYSHGLCTPGPKAEPPFEVDVVYSLFRFSEGKENSIYAIKIASLYTSWIIIKTIEELVSLVMQLKAEIEPLSRLNIKNLTSISPTKQEDRDVLIKIIFGSMLNTKSLHKKIQNFILTDAFSIEEIETFGIESIIAEIFGSEKGIYLVENKGWLRGWRCGYFQLEKKLLVRSSAVSGKVTEIIDTEKNEISISGNALKATDKLKQNERTFFANDRHSLYTLRSWFSNEK